MSWHPRFAKSLKLNTQIITASVLFACSVSTGGADARPPKPMPLSNKLGNLHHPVSTANALAQRYFNQGLTLIFSFNHDAAIRSFERALAFDPNLAMAWWGIGFSRGPNINQPVSPEQELAAYEAAQKAISLSANSTPEEKDYIAALAVRYSNDPKADLRKLDIAFKDAMRSLMQKYPDDLDAATLFAESMMDLRPWQLWTKDGKPADVTLETIEVLESVLRRDPLHPGANHYYIHAVEASPHPERGLPSAVRLETYAPAAGHLVHMPAHIYLRTGDYAAAARRNEVASEVDLDYVQLCGVQGYYPALYTSHNMHFAAVAHALQGNLARARRYAQQLHLHARPIAENVADLEAFLPTTEQVLVAFRQWDEILALPEPPKKFEIHRGFWLFARGLAFASQGQTEQAAAELNALSALRDALSPDKTFAGGPTRAKDILEIARLQLQARLAQAQGNVKGSIPPLQKAVELEDALRYMEPPDWYLFGREKLGGALLSDNQPVEAEAVFRKDLQYHQRKGRALFGLEASLRLQGRQSMAKMVAKGLDAAWASADTALDPLDIGWVANVK